MPLDTYAKEILSTNPKNKHLSSEMAYSCIKDAFYSSRTRGLFSVYFEDEIYNYAMSYYENASYGKVTHAYSILGITRVLEDVEISQRNYLPYRDMQRFLEQDFTTMHKGGINIPMNLLRYLTARIDIKLLTTTGDFQIQSVSDEEASILKPRWMQENCIGYQIQSYVGQLNFIAKTTVDGKIWLSLLGVDVRTPEDKSVRIPYWIDYTKLIINEETIFDTLKPAWHDKPYYYTMEVKAGEEVKLQIEWLPHRSDT